MKKQQVIKIFVLQISAMSKGKGYLEKWKEMWYKGGVWPTVFGRDSIRSSMIAVISKFRDEGHEFSRICSPLPHPHLRAYTHASP